MVESFGWQHSTLGDSKVGEEVSGGGSIMNHRIPVVTIRAS